MNTAARMPDVKYSVTRLGGGVTSQGIAYPGGLDLTTPSLSLQPGAVTAGVNFECSQSGGYARIQGYERTDGQAAPSAALYRIVQVSIFTNVPSVGQTLAQDTSGATGTIIAVNNVAGAYYVALTQVIGDFDYTHQVKVSSTVIGPTTVPNVTISAKTNAQYLAAAADVYRALIGAVPGSGKILGVVGMVFSGVDNLYAFRANLLGTAVALYKASASGWTLVPFLDTVSFTSGGTATPQDGETLTQGGVTATIKRVATKSGAWTGSAAGAFIITAPSGGNFGSGSATTTSGASVTLSGIQTAITLAPGGRFEFVKCNFSGQSVTRRIYSCDGVNKAFEFDGTILAPITTGLSPDKPSHIAFHKGYLVLSQDSSIFGSAPDAPFDWDANHGAWEIACGDTVTDMLTLPGDQSTAALAVYLRSNTSVLYGTSPADFNYVTFNTGSGGLPYSAQNLFDSFVFDSLGVVTLRSTLSYGNFASTALTKNILPFILQERTKLVASSAMRDKSQYRVFFSDGYGLYLTVANQQYLGALPVLFPNPVFVCDDVDLADGGGVSYFGSSDSLGYVYAMDAGTSFDGASLDAYISLAWDPIKSPRILKRWRHASIEMQGSSYAEISFGYKLGYGSSNIGQPANVNYPSGFSQSLWDSFTWDSFVWDGQTLFPTEVDMTGTAENVQYTIACTGNYIDAFNTNSIISHYTPRRGMRN